MELKSFFFWPFLIFTLILCQTENHLEKKRRLIVCNVLFRTRLLQDQKFLISLAEYFNQYFQINTGSHTIHAASLLNCFRNIKQKQIFHIISAMNVNKIIDSLTNEHKKLLGLEDSKSMHDKVTSEAFQKEFQELSPFIEELRLDREDFISKRDMYNFTAEESPPEEKRSEAKQSQVHYHDLCCKISDAIRKFRIISLVKKMLTLDFILWTAVIFIFCFILKQLYQIFLQNRSANEAEKIKEAVPVNQKNQDHSDKKNE